MNKVNIMNTIFIKSILVSLLLINSTLAADIKEIRARNDIAEHGLMKVRVQQAKAILAGTDQQVSWHDKVIQLNGFVDDIGIYATGQTNNNYSAAINASQQLIKELGTKYSKRIYGSKRPDNWQDDPMLVNFVTSFRVLKQLENHPELYAQLYPQLQQELSELDTLIQNR